jgi:hypothetical protein
MYSDLTTKTFYSEPEKPEKSKGALSGRGFLNPPLYKLY